MPKPKGPWTTGDCADWMGMSREFIRQTIARGQLRAERVTVNRRTVLRVHPADFVEFLRKIGWKRLPRLREGAHG